MDNNSSKSHTMESVGKSLFSSKSLYFLLENFYFSSEKIKNLHGFPSSCVFNCYNNGYLKLFNIHWGPVNWTSRESNKTTLRVHQTFSDFNRTTLRVHQTFADFNRTTLRVHQTLSDFNKTTLGVNKTIGESNKTTLVDIKPTESPTNIHTLKDYKPTKSSTKLLWGISNPRKVQQDYSGGQPNHWRDQKNYSEDQPNHRRVQQKNISVST